VVNDFEKEVLPSSGDAAPATIPVGDHGYRKRNA
jgi:hypothetical protein